MQGSDDTYSGRLLNSLVVPDKVLMLLTSKTTNGRLVQHNLIKEQQSSAWDAPQQRHQKSSGSEFFICSPTMYLCVNMVNDWSLLWCFQSSDRDPARISAIVTFLISEFTDRCYRHIFLENTGKLTFAQYGTFKSISQFSEETNETS